MNAVQESRIYRIGEVAVLLGIDRHTASRLIRSGEIPGAFRLGTRTLVRRAVFDRWLNHEAQTEKGIK